MGRAVPSCESSAADSSQPEWVAEGIQAEAPGSTPPAHHYLRMSVIPGIPQVLSTFQEPPCVCSMDSLTSSLKGDAIILTLQVWKLRLSETKISPGIKRLENAVAGILTQAVRPQDPAFLPCKNISQELIVQTSDVL